MNHHTNDYDRAPFFRWLYLPTVLIILIGFIGAFAYYMLDQHRREASNKSRIDNKVMSMQNNLSVFHLWLEEYLIGDSTIEIETIWPILIKAQEDLDLVLDGGLSEEGFLIYPLRDKELISEAIAIKELTVEFKALAEKRVELEDWIGTVLDQRSDTIFNKIIVSHNHFISTLDEQITEHNYKASRILLVTIVSWAATLLIAVVSLSIFEGRRRNVDEALKESEKYLNIAQEIAHIGHWKLNPETNEVIGSDELFRIFGLTREKSDFESFVEAVHPEDREFDVATIRRGIEHGEDWDIEHRLLLKDGTEKIVQAIGNAIIDETGKVVLLVGTVQDITERKRAEEQIKASLREKEILLKEIHHRVKNNLQVVSSMLNLQAGQIEDKELKEIFKESQGRIRSMALVHAQLYQSKDLSSISVSEYLKTLVANIFKSYVHSSSKVELKMEIEDIKLDIDTSMVLGLIVNELCSNALKYAFVDGRRGEIRVEFRRADNDNYFLLISDNGVGLPWAFDIDRVESMGFLLVISMVTQLDGTLEVDQSSGTNLRITFRREPAHQA